MIFRYQAWSIFNPTQAAVVAVQQLSWPPGDPRPIPPLYSYSYWDTTSIQKDPVAHNNTARHGYLVTESA